MGSRCICNLITNSGSQTTVRQANNGTTPFDLKQCLQVRTYWCKDLEIKICNLWGKKQEKYLPLTSRIYCQFAQLM